MVEFLAPLGWLVACAALLPIGAALIRDRREQGVRRVLGLVAPPPRVRFAGAVAAGVAVLLLAGATARPAIRTSSAAQLRTDAQAFFFVDISRSMLARQGHGGKTRYARALASAQRIRNGLLDIPAGVGSLTDRPLPHLFPSGNPNTFAAVLHRALGIERPPPSGDIGGPPTPVQTSFAALAQLAWTGYFGAAARHRLVVLFTDGESARYSPDAIATQLGSERIHLLVVRFWHPDERVYTGGRAERYRPDPGSFSQLERLADRTSHQPVFGERDTGGVVRAARSLLGDGPSVTVGRPKRLELAPYAALAALVPLALVLRRRDATGSGSPIPELDGAVDPESDRGEVDQEPVEPVPGAHEA
jgi:hypothetical protein